MQHPRLVVLLFATGCWSGYWGRRPIDHPTPLQDQEPVWIWTSGRVEKWHAVVITQEHVSGVPYQMSVHCDSCWRSIPLAKVDSMKVGYHTFPENVTYAVRATTLVVLGEIAAALLVHAIR
jgi:hypothetical protein